jgi:hypothetical protein
MNDTTSLSAAGAVRLTVDWAGTSGIDRSYGLLIHVVFLQIIVQVSRSFDPNMPLSRCEASPHEIRGPAGERRVKRDLDRLRVAQTSTFNSCPIRDSAAGGP